VGKVFEVVGYQPYWIHDGKKGRENFTRLDQRWSYSIAQRIDMNWGNGSAKRGWGNDGDNWETGGGWSEENEGKD